MKTEPHVKVKIIIRYIFFGAAFAVMALSLMPADKSFSLSAIDKVNHFIAYAVLAFLAVPGFQTERKILSTFLIGSLLITYGMGIEWLQGFVGRESSWWDVAANTGGITLGTITVLLAMDIANSPDSIHPKNSNES